MIIGVTGSRDWTSREIVAKAFDEAEQGKPDLERGDAPMIVIEGGAAGGDAICRIEANSRGWHVATVRAIWGFYGPVEAGHIRNSAMTYMGAHIWLAFINPCIKQNCTMPRPHDSHGTTNCIISAVNRGIRVLEYRNE